MNHSTRQADEKRARKRTSKLQQTYRYLNSSELGLSALAGEGGSIKGIKDYCGGQQQLRQSFLVTLQPHRWL